MCYACRFCDARPCTHLKGCSCTPAGTQPCDVCAVWWAADNCLKDQSGLARRVCFTCDYQLEFLAKNYADPEAEYRIRHERNREKPAPCHLCTQWPDDYAPHAWLVPELAHGCVRKC